MIPQYKRIYDPSISFQTERAHDPCVASDSPDQPAPSMADHTPAVAFRISFTGTNQCHLAGVLDVMKVMN